jgi:hypothetical protein
VEDNPEKKANELFNEAVQDAKESNFAAAERLFEDIQRDHPKSAAAQKVPGELAKLHQAMEAMTIAIMREINAAQQQFLKLSKRYAGTIEELIDLKFLKTDPSEIPHTRFQLAVALDGTKYQLTAGPRTPEPDDRFFYSDQTGEIRSELGKPATEASEKLAGSATP